MVQKNLNQNRYRAESEEKSRIQSQKRRDI